jgi:hypothetical protein
MKHDSTYRAMALMFLSFGSLLLVSNTINIAFAQKTISENCIILSYTDPVGTLIPEITQGPMGCLQADGAKAEYDAHTTLGSPREEVWQVPLDFDAQSLRSIRLLHGVTP